MNLLMQSFFFGEHSKHYIKMQTKLRSDCWVQKVSVDASMSFDAGMPTALALYGP